MKYPTKNGQGMRNILNVIHSLISKMESTQMTINPALHYLYDTQL